MKATLKSTRVIRTYVLEGAPATKRIYSDTQIIPAKVAVEFDNQTWMRVTLSGPRAKKDGSAGANAAEEWYDEFQADELPDWVRPFLDFNYQPDT